MVTFTLVYLLLAMSSSCSAADGDATTTSTPSRGQYLNVEHRLMVELTSEIDTNQRPVHNLNDTVVVNLGVSLVKLKEVDEKEGTLTLQGWKNLAWTDPQLTWNPADYGGVSSIRIPASMIWKPDIVLHNGASDTTDWDTSDELVVVYYIGMVLWIPRTVMTANCAFDLTNFPYDDHVCKFKFGSWIYDANMVDIQFYQQLEDVNVMSYLAHPEWNLKETYAQRTVKVYPCCPEPYVDVTFELHLNRRSSYRSYMYIGPPVLISIMLPFVFILPTLATSRYLVGTSGLIVMGVMILGLRELFPQGNMSLLSQYYMAVFSFNFVVVFVAVLITSVAYRSQKSSSPPAILKSIFINFLGSIFCIGIDVKGETETSTLSSGGGTGWMSIACVLDRLFCFITTILVVILGCTCIPR